MHSLAIDVAGTRLDLHAPEAELVVLSRRYRAFESDFTPARWTLELRRGRSPLNARTPRRVTARDGILRLEGIERDGYLDIAAGRGRVPIDPQLLVADALVRAALALDLCARSGCLLHAAALVVDGVAHVFPGRSGSGKSTLAGLSQDVLADEICAVLPEGAGFRVLGTPWWKGRPGAAPLAAVWTLGWDAERAEPLPPRRTLRHLCTNAIVPGLPEAEAAAFGLCGRVAASVPFGRLSFRRDTDVDALLRRRDAAA